MAKKYGFTRRKNYSVRQTEFNAYVIPLWAISVVFKQSFSKLQD